MQTSDSIYLAQRHEEGYSSMPRRTFTWIVRRGGSPLKQRATDFHQFEGSTVSGVVSEPFFSSRPIIQRIPAPREAFAWPARRSAAFRGCGQERLSSILKSSTARFVRTESIISRVHSSTCSG